MRNTSKGATTRLEIDGNKLKAIVYDKGLNASQVDRELGSGRGIANAISRNTISQPLLTLLQVQYGITLEDISPTVDTV